MLSTSAQINGNMITDTASFT